jgi:hypothetical protein
MEKKNLLLGARDASRAYPSPSIVSASRAPEPYPLPLWVCGDEVSGRGDVRRCWLVWGSFSQVVVGRCLLVTPPYLCKFSSTYKHHLVRKKHKEKRKTLTNGPNDARRVVWARFLRRCLPLAPPYLYSINRIYIHDLVAKKNTKEKRNTHLEPKRRETRRLDPSSLSSVHHLEP